MAFINLFLLLVGEFLAGMGLISLFGIRLPNRLTLPLAVLLGIAVFSFVPLVLQLLYIPLTASAVFLSIALVTVLLHARFQNSLAAYRSLTTFRVSLRLYELPFLAVMILLFVISIWRCWYYPPTPRDALSGPEVIAEYAVQEHTLLNSVFSVDLSTTNNPFKSPFLICLQLIYKLAGFPFGQLWLCQVFIFFIWFLYEVVNQYLHRFLTGILLLFFIAVPEMYAYTTLILYDYSNAVFFTLSLFFLAHWLQYKGLRHLAFSGVLMGFACYIRSETLILALLFLPLFLAHHWRHEKAKGLRSLLHTGLCFYLPITLFHLVSTTLYLGYLPLDYAIEKQLNPHLSDLHLLFQRWSDMNLHLLFTRYGLTLYGYLLPLFIISFVLEAIVFRFQFTRQGKFWLYATLVVYLGYPLLGYLLPLLDLDNSTKRGLFKLFPCLLLYLANNQLYTRLSQWLFRKYGSTVKLIH